MKKMIFSLALLFSLVFLGGCSTDDPFKFLQKFIDSNQYTLKMDAFGTLVYDNGDMFVNIKAGIVSMEMYIITEDEKTTAYVKDNASGNWIKSPLPYSAIQEMIKGFDMLKEESKKYLENQGLFELNEENEWVGKAEEMFANLKIKLDGDTLSIEENGMLTTVSLSGNVKLPKGAVK